MLIPAHVQSLAHRLFRRAKFFAPVADALRLPVHRDVVGVPRVSRLDCSRRPAAVAWSVVPVIVFALQREARRARPHVREKLLEALGPSVAHFNSSASIVSIGPIAGIRASTFGARPHIVFAGRWPVVWTALAVGCFTRFKQFTVQTSAALAVTGAQRVCGDFLLPPTLTSAKPTGSVSSGSARNNKPTTKRLSCQIHKPSHKENCLA